MNKLYKAKEIASWFLVREEIEKFIKNNFENLDGLFIKENKPFTISSIHILLYFVQMLSFGTTGNPLFSNKIYIKNNFMIVDNLYENLDKILTPKDEDTENFYQVEQDDQTNLILEKIYREFGYESDVKLNKMIKDIILYYETSTLDKEITIHNLKNYQISKPAKKLKENDLYGYADTRSLVHYLSDPKARKYNMEILAQ